MGRNPFSPPRVKPDPPPAPPQRFEPGAIRYVQPVQAPSFEIVTCEYCAREYRHTADCVLSCVGCGAPLKLSRSKSVGPATDAPLPISMDWIEL